MKTTVLKPAAELEAGMQIRYLGAVRTVTSIRRSLGNGFTVTLADGPSATFVGTVGAVVDC